MKRGFFTLAENRILKPDTHLLRLEGDTSAIARPGQFVQIELPGFFLKRPFSVCDWDERGFTVIVEAAGAGTMHLLNLDAGTELLIHTGLGNGFTPPAGTGKGLLLIGVGTGLSPMVGLASRYPEAEVLLAFRSRDSAFGEKFFAGHSVRITEDILTMMEAIPHNFFCACGSEAAMRAVCCSSKVPGQIAFDVRMGCGFGACMGCSKKTINGYARVCREGPVFWKEELLWED